MPEWRVKVEQKEYEEVLAERCQLAVERIREIGGEDLLQPEFGDYFKRTAEFLLLLEETRQFLKSGKAKQASLKELQKRNKSLYEDILPENYEKSYGNPAFAVEKLGEYGQGLSWLYVQMRAGIGAVYVEKQKNMSSGWNCLQRCMRHFPMSGRKIRSCRKKRKSGKPCTGLSATMQIFLRKAS